MRDIYIYTDVEINKEDCLKIFKDNFPSHHIRVNSDEQIFIGFYPNEFAINFEDFDINNIICDDIEQYKLKIPSSHHKHCYWFQYNKIEIARKAILLLLQIYPNIYLTDNDFEWFGYGKDFILSKHQEK